MTDTKWILGFSKNVITPNDYDVTEYYSAGYVGGCRCTEVLTDMYVRAVYLEADNKKTVIAEIDCVGMSNNEVLDIRIKLKDLTDIGISVNVCFTHCHSAVDTQGLWGKLPRSGRVEKYNASVREIAAKTIREAYEKRTEGDIFWGDIPTEGIIEDTREPIVFDDKLTRFRFVPKAGGKEVFLIHLAVHPEILGPRNPKISSDFPGFMGQILEENTGCEFMFINGAIGGQIVVPNLDGIYDKTLDNVAECKRLGALAARYCLNVQNEKPLRPFLLYKNIGINIPICNQKFVLAKKFGLINNIVIKNKKKVLGCKYCIKSELAYLELGDIKIMMIPGELAPEIAMGGYMPAELSANGYALSDDDTIFAYMKKAEKKLIIGLANDEIGYILPPNDFFVHKLLPYILEPIDRNGISHYNETNSTGLLTCQTILDACKELLKEVYDE